MQSYPIMAGNVLSSILQHGPLYHEVRNFAKETSYIGDRQGSKWRSDVDFVEGRTININ